MVVFTCQHCGDPVKKPSVEKHYNTRCRFKSPHLTCVDCLKDFSCDDYGSHNQCVTELQRYSAQGTVFKEQKGKKKQEQYVEMIQEILNSKDLSLSPVQRNLLELCSTYDNLPRKPKPFENFLRNSARQKLRNCSIEDIRFVFSTIEDAWKKQIQPSNSPAKEKEGITVQGETKSNGSLSVETLNKTNEEITDDRTNSDMGKKSKKRKNSDKSLSLGNENEDLTTYRTTNDDNEEKTTDDTTSLTLKKAKKKKIRDKLENSNGVVPENEVAFDESFKNMSENVHNGESNRIKKENQKKKSLCLDNEDKANPEENDGCSSSEKVIDSKHVTTDDIKENVNKISKKQLKKQKKYEKYLATLEYEAESKPNENAVITDVEESTEVKKKKKKNKKIKTIQVESDPVALTEDKNTVNINDLTMKLYSKKNKKRKLEEPAEEIPEKKMKEITEEGEERPTAGVFNWADVIMSVLQSRPDKELSLKKLGKKVVNEYQVVKNDHRTYEELLAKFNKKVNKVKGVRVLKDRAKLID